MNILIYQKKIRDSTQSNQDEETYALNHVTTNLLHERAHMTYAHICQAKITKSRSPMMAVLEKFLFTMWHADPLK